MVWLIVSFFAACKAYHVVNRDESYYYLRKLLGVGPGGSLFCGKIHKICASTRFSMFLFVKFLLRSPLFHSKGFA